MGTPRRYRPTVAEIDLSALRFNYAQIKKMIGSDCKVMAVVKANAYGHGSVAVSKVLEQSGVSFLAVAYLEEGVRLREAGIRTPIVILTGGQDPEFFRDLEAFQLTPVFYRLDCLRAYEAYNAKRGRQAEVHIKFDTGMNRLGFSPEAAAELFLTMPSLKHLNFEAAMMHFANAERISEYNQKQITLFKKFLAECPVKFKYIDQSNSGALLNDFGVNGSLVRPGITLYGAYPKEALKEKLELKPVMSLKTRIIQLKKVKKGSFVSYGYTHQFRNDSLLATLPIGYDDGYFRHLSNKGKVIIRGTRAPIVGIICMDVMMVDVSGVQGVACGDEVVLIGRQGDESIGVEEIARISGTIPWEILCNISARVPRIYS